MIKKIVSFVLILVFFVSTIGQAYGASAYNIASLNNNIFKIESANYGANMRVMVEKGNDKYYYSLNNLTEEIPAQLGSGAYIVKILQNTSGNKYKVVSKSTLDVMNNSLDVYLSSSQPVYWEGKDKLVELANTIITDNSSNEEITKAVYDYIIENIKYDHYKINNIGTDYVPDIEEIIESKKGICYDYAALFAGLLRSQGIHTKLVKGYKNDMKEYHAWNEVLLNGKWVIIDTTYDAAFKNSSVKISMQKLDDEYNKVREY